jgi:hypothetical protein
MRVPLTFDTQCSEAIFLVRLEMIWVQDLLYLLPDREQARSQID